MLSTPLAADFGPGGPEAAGKGAQLDRDLALHASRRLLRAWPGGGGGGEHDIFFLRKYALFLRKVKYPTKVVGNAT